MYASFYNLELEPFQIDTDPAFLWTGEKHKEALATLRYGILNNKGFLLLTGDVGTGKTTLINALVQSLNNDIICASVPDPNLEFIDFINYIAFAFGIETVFKTKGHFVIEFRKFLLDAYQKEKKVLLIIDESQLLTEELLEQIRLLSNIELADTKLLNIFFVGQNEFNDILSKENNRAVRQRLTLNYNLDPLTVKETGEYIKYRLKVAGTNNELFTRGAVQKIHLYSKGFPRKINIICDHCLLSGYVNEKNTINTSIVNECAQELRIPSEVKPYRFNFFLGSFFSKKKVSDQQDTSKILRGCLITMFTFLFCSILTLFFYISPSIFKQKTEITNNSKPYVETKSEKLSDQLKNEEKQETIKKEKNTEKQNSKKEQLADIPSNSQIIPEANPIVTEPDVKAMPPIEEMKIIIRFNHNSNNLPDDDIAEINKFADILLKYPHERVIVTGYSDSRGNLEYNKKLSKFRANIVKSFLMGKGILPEQIIEKGLGSKNPVASNDTSFGRKMNRRVEVEIYKNNY